MPGRQDRKRRQKTYIVRKEVSFYTIDLFTANSVT